MARDEALWSVCNFYVDGKKKLSADLLAISIKIIKTVKEGSKGSLKISDKESSSCMQLVHANYNHVHTFFCVYCSVHSCSQSPEDLAPLAAVVVSG